MKKLLILISLYSLTSFSQDYSGEINYLQRRVKPLVSKKKIVNAFFNMMEKGLDNYKFEYVLFFNSESSLFEGVPEIKNNKSSYRLASMASGFNKKQYQNRKTKEVLEQKTAFGEEFIIKSSFDDYKWKLQNEVKKIHNYTCLKASTIRVVKNSKGTFKKQVIVWYTTQIPYNYGPKGYGGLPGLTLELIDDKFKYTVTKIKLLSKKKIEIKKPTKGIVKTPEEFNKLAKKLFEERRRGR